MTELSGARVLITGAASGLGRLLAQEAAAQGASVILWDIDQQALSRCAETISASGSTVAAHRCDLRDAEAIRRTAERVLADHGGVDVLINNAGVVSGKSFFEMTDEDFLHTMEVNAFAPVRITGAFLPSMLERDSGHIVNISSAAAIVGSARLVDYCASKFALFGFDEALRIDLRHCGSAVRTTVVCPYYIDTGMFAGVRTRFSWLLPILEPRHVAKRVIGAILRNRRRLVMPWFVYAAWPLRLVPVGLFDRLIDFFGISRSMEDFTGRNP